MSFRLSHSPIRRLLVVALSGVMAWGSVSAAPPPYSAPQQDSADSLLSPPVSGSSTGGAELPGDVYWTGAGDNDATAGAVTPGSILAGSVKAAAGSSQSKVKAGRVAMISSAAAAYGAQAGLYYQSEQIVNALKAHADEYDRTFNFSTIELSPGFLPPVIEEGVNLYKQNGDSEVRAASCLYRIESPAKLVNTAPVWESYLAMPLIRPALPTASVLPKGKAEEGLWNDWARKGWNQGVHQADLSFESNLGRLKRDFSGMLLYKQLYELGLVQAPVKAEAVLGTTGGGKEMALGDRIIRITRPADLNPAQANWFQQHANYCAPN